MKITIMKTFVTSLILLVVLLFCSDQGSSEYEKKSNEIVKLLTTYYDERYGDQFVLYEKSFTPNRETGDYLNIYEGYLTQGPQNIVKKRLSEYVGKSTLDSIRKHEMNKNWQNVSWKNETIRLSSDMDRTGNEIKLFISSILFNPTFDKAILYMETHKQSSVTGLIYALRLERNGEWRWAPGLPAYSAD